MVAPTTRLASARRETIIERTDLAQVFHDAGAMGCFAAFDGASDTFTLVGAERAVRRFVPASTFKITNALIALETGVIADAREVIPYGGKPQPFKAWEKDMTIAEAIPASNVPVFQEIARRVGIERYRTWLDKLDYGNGETGEVVDRFWLDGPLQISAMEQAVFLDRLARRELPVSRRVQDVTAAIIRLEESNGRILFGKTGWKTPGQPGVGAAIGSGTASDVGSVSGSGIGWWAGWVVRADRAGILAFALNIDMADLVDAPKRLTIGKALLSKLGAWD